MIKDIKNGAGKADDEGSYGSEGSDLGSSDEMVSDDDEEAPRKSAHAQNIEDSK